MKFVVFCSECCEEHSTKDVEFLNIEEDIQGRDIMHYICPVTHTPTKAPVFGK